MNYASGEDSIRLLLLEDQGLFRSGLARLLAEEPGFGAAGECDTVHEALEILRRGRVDVVLLDIDLGPEHLTEFISAARSDGYAGAFLTLAGRANLETAAKAIKGGASGIFLKSESVSRLVQAVRLLAGGGVWVDPSVMKLLADGCVSQPAVPLKTPAGRLIEDRQQRVLAGIVSGFTNRKIADEMGLSEGTVKNILQQMFSMAGVRTRSQLVCLALEGAFGDPRHFRPRNEPAGPEDEQPPGRPGSHAEAVTRPIV
ncbi:MAG TPA: response regulator transcription factor [Bryobacteraceae bacterium]|nr:response regulator transcription factor [Bryobacteraceae bacterium]